LQHDPCGLVIIAEGLRNIYRKELFAMKELNAIHMDCVSALDLVMLETFSENVADVDFVPMRERLGVRPCPKGILDPPLDPPHNRNTLIFISADVIVVR
jgi:hypothetical protein